MFIGANQRLMPRLINLHRWLPDQLTALVTKIIQDLIWSHVRLCHQNRIPSLPPQKLSKFFQVIKRSCGCFAASPLVRDHERSVHTKSGDPNQKTHDLLNLVANRRIAGIEIRLIRIKPMEIVSLGQLVEFPDTGLFAREYSLVRCIAWIILSPNIIAVIFQILTTGGLKPGMLVGRVIDHEIDDHANTAIVRFRHEIGEIAKAQSSPDGAPRTSSNNGLSFHTPKARLIARHAR